VRFSTRDPSIRPATNKVSAAEFSPVDLKWSHLVDENGKATPRLGEFLRGLANHIVSVLVEYAH
jgi:hypothetical protein